MAAKPRLWTRGFILDTLVNFLIYIIYYMLMVIIASEAIHSLNASVSEAGLASGLFVLGTLVARLFAGRSVELYGRKKMLYAGILFYLVTTCMYFLVDSLPMMYGVRLLKTLGLREGWHQLEKPLKAGGFLIYRKNNPKRPLIEAYVNQVLSSFHVKEPPAIQ